MKNFGSAKILSFCLVVAMILSVVGIHVVGVVGESVADAIEQVFEQFSTYRDTNFRSDLINQRPRIILGSDVSLEEFERRVLQPGDSYQAAIRNSAVQSALNAPATGVASLPNNGASYDIFFGRTVNILIGYRIALINYANASPEELTARRNDVQNIGLRLVSHVERIVEIYPFLGEDNSGGPSWHGERGSCLEAAAGLTAMGLMYDWTYDLPHWNHSGNVLDEGLRTLLRERILLHANNLYRIWIDGEPRDGFDFTPSNTDVDYWRNDFQNNHVHGRAAAILIATGAIMGSFGVEDEDDQLVRDMFNWAEVRLRNIAYWHAPDGTSHEGTSYLLYGGEKLFRALAVHTSLTGDESLWDYPGIRNRGIFQAYLYAPGLRMMHHWATHDGHDERMGYHAAYMFRIASQYNDGQLMGLLRDVADAISAHPTERANPWSGHFTQPGMAFLWYDDSIASEPWEQPNYRHFNDLELINFRTGWGADDISMTLKGGPPGGHRLNEYMHGFLALNPSLPPEERRWFVNMAHSLPEAQNIVMFFGGHQWGQTPHTMRRNIPRYTRHHNSMLVNGRGQTFETTQTGFSARYTAPLNEMARVTQFFGSDGFGFATSDATGAYRAWRGSNGNWGGFGNGVGPLILSRYERSLLFIDGRYFVTIDDIAMLGNTTGTFTYIFRNSGEWDGSWNPSENRGSYVITQTTTGNVTVNQQAQMELHVMTSGSANGVVSPPPPATLPNNAPPAQVESMMLLGSELAVETPALNATRFAGVYFPRIDGEYLDVAPTMTTTGIGVNAVTRVTVDRGERVDEILYRGNVGEIDAAGISAYARTVFYTRGDEHILNSVMIDGTRLELPTNSPSFTASNHVNMRYERLDFGFNLRVERPLGRAASASAVTIRELKPNTQYFVLIDGVVTEMQSTAQGQISFTNLDITQALDITVLGELPIAGFTAFDVVSGDVRLQGINTTDEPLTAFVVLAMYDIATGRFAGAFAKPISINPNSGAFDFLVWDGNLPPIVSGFELDVFLWDSALDMSPTELIVLE